MKPARRRQQWRRLVKPVLRFAVVAVVLAYGIYRGSDTIAHARMLEIQQIKVRGNDRVSSGDVVGRLSGMRGESLLWSDLEAWRQRLLGLSWVRDAQLRRTLPGTVEVTLTERQPLAIARRGSDLYLIDETGTTIAAYGPEYSSFDLPIVDGLSGEPAPDEPRIDLAARVIAALRAKPDVARRVSQIDVKDSHNAAVILSGDPAIVYVGEDQFLGRLESYLQLAAALRERVPQIDYVDLRFDGRIYVRPVPGKASGRAAVTAAMQQTTTARVVRRNGGHRR